VHRSGGEDIVSNILRTKCDVGYPRATHISQERYDRTKALVSPAKNPGHTKNRANEEESRDVQCDTLVTPVELLEPTNTPQNAKDAMSWPTNDSTYAS
jgi:hypothetical protein